MDRRRLLFALAGLGLFTLHPVHAADDPKALVTVLYEVQAASLKKGPQPTDASQRATFFNRRILTLLAADDKLQAREGMGHLDFDVFYDGQDSKVTELAVGEPSIQGEAARIIVRFKNFGAPRELQYELARQDGVWRIANIRKTKGDPTWDFVSVLQGK